MKLKLNIQADFNHLCQLKSHLQAYLLGRLSGSLGAYFID